MVENLNKYLTIGK